MLEDDIQPQVVTKASLVSLRGAVKPERPLLKLFQ
jgi:hypothetical protein